MVYLLALRRAGLYLLGSFVFPTAWGQAVSNPRAFPGWIPEKRHGFRKCDRLGSDANRRGIVMERGMLAEGEPATFILRALGHAVAFIGPIVGP